VSEAAGDRVRDAMLAEPKTLAVTATAQEAAQLLRRPEVRAVLVCDGDLLIGIVTAAGLVERVLAEGLDPRTTPLGAVVEELPLTIGPDEPLDAAYQLMEEEDVERLAVTAEGRLVGVLSRSALQRRLAEDEAPEDELEPESESA
jgi:CBS domain-containing protein